MRLVLDTNVTLSGLLWHGPPAQLLATARRGEVNLVTSIELFDEFFEIVSRRKFARRIAERQFNIDDLVDAYSALFTIARPAQLASPVSRDPDDDIVLATALGGGADLIVSGDRDLLDLETFQGIPIISAAAMLARLSN